MKYRSLGRTGLSISEICLGTMTWGSQNSEAEGHAQMDLAVEMGVNVFDVAEMYPTTPLLAETVGRTEEIIGTWFAKTGRRDDITLASKITGAGNEKVRGGEPITADSVRRALDGSLKRLQTDRIDLYQLHWPNRGSYHFRQNWGFDPSGQQPDAVKANIEEVLHELGEQVKAGKIRHVGLSNESAWGVMQFASIAERDGTPRIASIQNEYSLMHRIFDLDLAETALNEQVGLLAYTPLAAGLLTGKYTAGAIPPGTRGAINKGLGGRHTEYAVRVADEYCEVARRHGLDPAQMAIAFCLTRPFMTSVIIGATNLEQLKTDIAAAEVTLSDEVMSAIAAVYRRHPLPL
ncbi:aldo/keto reductase [Jiella sp. MQZ9-1]|uniref:Aldo/keto reductase n=1 Tax=Jiella flava TaxID=2816857 RepID=A0A939FYT8_9HYPH|nr:aldo/keto reductase [Jiella flava]MBO0662711.1 aldo/keto reductase [Jiella flava]MCD2471133.1 aldo/keto reductase [Jiella flava]